MDPKHVKPASAAAQALGWVDEKTRAKTSINDLLRD